MLNLIHDLAAVVAPICQEVLACQIQFIQKPLSRRGIVYIPRRQKQSSRYAIAID